MYQLTIQRGVNVRHEPWAKKFDARLPPISSEVALIGELPEGLAVAIGLDGRFARLYVYGATNAPQNAWAVVVQFKVTQANISGEPGYVSHYAITLDIELTGEPDPNAIIPSGPPTQPSPSPGEEQVTYLDFRTALLRARQGGRVRRVGWEDRWVSWAGFYQLTLINPLTGTQLTTRIVRSTDASPEWWGARWQEL